MEGWSSRLSPKVACPLIVGIWNKKERYSTCSSVEDEEEDNGQEKQKEEKGQLDCGGE
jgi:hypothetical protein